MNPKFFNQTDADIAKKAAEANQPQPPKPAAPQDQPRSCHV